METEQNGGKQAFNRRWKSGILGLSLVTVAYYVCLFTGKDLSWFIEYSKPVTYIVAGIIIGISVTDTMWNWKK